MKKTGSPIEITSVHRNFRTKLLLNYASAGFLIVFNCVQVLTFNMLKLWGAWPIDTSDPVKKKLSKLYSYLTGAYVLAIIYMGILDFIDATKDFRKLSWNLCVSITLIGTFTKNVYNYRDSDEIDRLRRVLCRDLKTCNDSRETGIVLKHRRNMRKIMKTFHYPLFFFFPLYALDSLYKYLNGEDLPLPWKWPFHLDKNDFFTGGFVFGFQIFSSGILLLNAMTTDFATFGLLIQISMEYELLLKRIQELKEFILEETENSNDEKEIFDEGEIEVISLPSEAKKKEIKLMVGKIIDRQKDLVRYTEKFERYYNLLMLIQLTAGGLLVVVNCVQTLTLSLEFHLKSTPQAAYVAIITIDIFIICVLCNNISDHCWNVGNAIYDLPWYGLSVDIRRDFITIILKSQKPPRLSARRFVDLNMETFSETMKNIYRWLAVFRQLGFS